jgi:hypothetical protein
MAKKLVTPAGVASYPHLDLPQAAMNGQGNPKYSLSLVFAKGTDLTALQAAVLEAAIEKFGANAAAKIKSGALKSPFRTDAEAKGYPEGSTFINVRSEQKPGTVYLYPGADGKPAIVPDDKVKETFYAGATVRASITAFAYDRPESKGVSVGLNNVQLLDGTTPRLDGRTKATDDFEADASMKPASLDDVE